MDFARCGLHMLSTKGRCFTFDESAGLSFGAFQNTCILRNIISCTAAEWLNRSVSNFGQVVMDMPEEKVVD